MCVTVPVFVAINRTIAEIWRYMLSLCLFVPPSDQAGIVSKRQNVALRKQSHTIEYGLQLSDAKDLGEIPMESLPTGAPNTGQVWYVKIGDFRPISRCILQTVQDRDIVTMEG